MHNIHLIQRRFGQKSGGIILVLVLLSLTLLLLGIGLLLL